MVSWGSMGFSWYCQQNWEKEGLTYQDAQEWILAGFEPNDEWKVRKWKSYNFTPQEVKSWLETGLNKGDYEFAAYLRYKSYQSSPDLNLEWLREEFGTWLKENKPTQELDISHKNLTDTLDHNDFVNLKKSKKANAMTKTQKPRKMEIFDNPNLFSEADDERIFYRVFGYWKCANGWCNRRWVSAFTWALLEKCQDDTCSQILLDKKQDYWQQECNNCGSKFNFLTKIEELIESVSEPHKAELCAKCQAHEYCDKAVTKCWGYGYGIYICNDCERGVRCDNSLVHQEIRTKIIVPFKLDNNLEGVCSRFFDQLIKPLLSARHDSPSWKNLPPHFLHFYNAYRVKYLNRYTSLDHDDWQLVRTWVRSWIDNEFTYPQIQDWANSFGIYFDPSSDANVCAWLRDIKELIPLDLMIDRRNVNKLRKLKKEYQESRLTVQIPLKKQELEQLTNTAKEKLTRAERYPLEKLLKKHTKTLQTGDDSNSEKVNELKEVLSEKLTQEELQVLLNKQKQVWELEEHLASLQASTNQSWTNLHPNFTLKLVQRWQNQGFTYEQARDWINIHSPADQTQAIQEPEFYAWLRDIKKVDSDWVLNYGNIAELKQEYQASQQTAQILQPNPPKQ